MRMSGVGCLAWQIVYTVDNCLVPPEQALIKLIACRKKVYDEIEKAEEIR